MDNTLFLIAAGGFWVCCVIGAGLWWVFHRTRGGFPVADAGLVSAVDLEECPASQVEGPTPSELATQSTDSLRLTSLGESLVTVDADQPRSSASSLRFPYPQRQWMAPCFRGRLPSVDDFGLVECQELFGDGISFHLESPCQAETLVISLGTRTTMIFMLARVVSRSDQPEAAPSKCLVECRFIRRVREGTGPWIRGLKSASGDENEMCVSGSALA